MAAYLIVLALIDLLWIVKDILIGITLVVNLPLKQFSCCLSSLFLVIKENNYQFLMHM